LKHGWNSLDDYLYQHQRRLEDYPAFIKDYNIDFLPYFQNNHGFLVLFAEILFVNEIKLTVEKSAEVAKFGHSRYKARTIDYSYNASIINKGNIIRYDNAHVHKGHPTIHHKHVYDPPDIEIEGSPFPLEEDNWPHMHEVIEELIDYPMP
jgi:hypothetical protein